MLEGEWIEPSARLGELTSLSKEGKDAAGKGVNLECLRGAPALALAPAGWNPSHPVVPLAGKYMTGVVAPDLLPVLAAAAAAAHPPFPNPATTLLPLLAPPPPDPKEASEVGRLVSISLSELWGVWCERRDEERMDCALLQGLEEDLGVHEYSPPPRRRDSSSSEPAWPDALSISSSSLGGRGGGFPTMLRGMMITLGARLGREVVCGRWSG